MLRAELPGAGSYERYYTSTTFIVRAYARRRHSSRFGPGPQPEPAMQPPSGASRNSPTCLPPKSRTPDLVYRAVVCLLAAAFVKAGSRERSFYDPRTRSVFLLRLKGTAVQLYLSASTSATLRPLSTQPKYMAR